MSSTPLGHPDKSATVGTRTLASEQGGNSVNLSVQGALLFTGFGIAQVFSFARNALLGHALSPHDFGIAASIALVLQTLEVLSDLGVDRLIVQAKDGDRDDFLATTHTILIARGVILSIILFAIAPYAVSYFSIPEALGAFHMIALVPLIKSFVHMDCRRAQRRFDNRPQLLVDVVPQAMALAATLPILKIFPGFEAVVALALLQACFMVAVALYTADVPYRVGFQRDVARLLVRFGWPILLSALPLVAVYQGDRAIIGRFSGMAELGAYSAAFMITMVPGLVAARAGHALMLPVFSNDLREHNSLQPSFALMAEATTILAAVYVSVFIVAGGTLLTIAFGPAYRGLDGIVGGLAIMWAMRMLQAVPGMALMAAGQTKPFLIAGIIRASVLPVVFYRALHGATLEEIAGIACVGEALSLLYVALRMQKLERGLCATFLCRSVFLIPAAVTAGLMAHAAPEGFIWTLVNAAVLGSIVLAAGIGMMPSLRSHARRILTSHVVLAQP